MPAVLVTGASTGIGRACALHLVADGWTVYAGVRRPEDGEALAADARPTRSGALRPVRLDVTDEAQVAAVADEIRGDLGPVRFGGVVNNAGIAIGGPLEGLPLDYWREQLEVNVVGQVAVTRAFLPLVRSGAGRVVFVGSLSGRVGMGLMAPYTASKFAVEGLAESLRVELDPWGIPVVVVEPGAIATPIWGKGRSLVDRLKAEAEPAVLAQYAEAIATVERGIERQERTGISPDRVARVVARALTVDSPRPRYPVGPDAHAGALLSRLLPDRVRHRLLCQLGELI